MSARRIIINRCPPEHYAFALEAVRFGLDEAEMPNSEAIVLRRGSGAFFIKRTPTTISVFWQPDTPTQTRETGGDDAESAT